MFSQVSVILSTIAGICLWREGVCLLRGSALSGGIYPLARGGGGLLSAICIKAEPPAEILPTVVFMHPTGMQSCFKQDLEDISPFCGPTDAPCFGLVVTFVLCFKARMDSLACTQQIHHPAHIKCFENLRDWICQGISQLSSMAKIHQNMIKCSASRDLMTFWVFINTVNVLMSHSNILLVSARSDTKNN